MATPFDEGGVIDLDGAARLARALVEAGNEGLVVTGSTGEAPTLNDGERLELWRTVASAVTVPVLAGSTSNDTAHSVELTAAASRTGVAGILAVTPYYNRPHQAGLLAHFSAVAGATPLPVVLYDIPVRTGRKVASSTILQLAREVPNVLGLKDAAGDAAATARLLAEAPSGFDCYSGDDALTLALCAVGAGGLIGVASHWAAPELSAMLSAFFSGDLARALEVQRVLQESFAFETGDEAPNPLPTKAMLRVMGLPAGQCRLPLGRAPEGLEQRAKAVLAELEAWRDAQGERDVQDPRA
ncbi:MAG: 4-hydroxy-tetrahydrodipicolinate synthase [Acidimicrobiaceae bacterium]|nr:4-hydroxy-tetrahydrodipicolinate synthase [Acidimicrobiaceae bacterium]